MIEGSNSSVKIFDDYNPDAGNASADGNVSMYDVIANLRQRRETVLNGGINCIPFPFKRFRSEIPGIEQEQYVVITASTKGGKTQFMSYVYLYHVLDYVFEHSDQCSVHIIYFNFEESQMRIKQRYISHLLNKIYGIRISPTDLRSTNADNPLPESIFEKIESDKIMERLEFFDKCVQFEAEDTNPTGVLRICEEYAKTVGDYNTYQRRSRANKDKVVNVFKSYTPHDPNHYKLVIFDHLSLIDLERGMSLKQSMDKLSEYAVKYLRNRYKYTVIAVQQQAMESEGLDAIKQKKLVPAVATLGDTKYTARDANLVIGLFDPSFFGLPTWLQYKIADQKNEGLQNYGRFAYVLRGRDGEQGGVCPLFFDGATCTLEELPKPEDTDLLEKYYDRVKKYKTQRQQKKLSSLISLLFTKRIKNDNTR